MSDEELQRLRDENKRLKEQVAALRRQLDQCIELRRAQARRSYEDNYDYVPYHEYEER